MEKLTQRVQLEPDEQILLVVHKHWFILLRDIIIPILLFVIPVGFYLATKNTEFVTKVIAGLPHKDAILLFFVSLWGLVTWMMLFLVWTDYYLDMWTITDRRIIAIDQRGLFRRSIASFRYERLQDISVEINGFIATMLDFGDIHTETAGQEADFRIGGIPDPRAVKALILESADKLLIERQSSVHNMSHENGV